MRVLITGAAGFVGSHLCDLWLSRGHQVIGLDNFITGKLANLQHLEDNSAFQLVQQDVTEEIRISGDIDFVLHFASPASPVDYANLPIQTLKAGALGTHKALGVARAKGARFLLASSSEVYGDPLVSPQTEDYWGNVNFLGPRGVYDEAKRFAEALVMAYRRMHGLDCKITRIFNTYGPRMRPDDGRVVPNFVGQALRGEPLTVFGDGSQTRSFCYVSDLVEGVYRLALSDVQGPVNVGNPEETTVLEFARKVIALTGSRSTVVFRPLPENDPRLRRPDISRARRLLGWEPIVPLDVGLSKTIDWFRALDKANA